MKIEVLYLFKNVYLLIINEMWTELPVFIHTDKCSSNSHFLFFCLVGRRLACELCETAAASSILVWSALESGSWTMEGKVHTVAFISGRGGGR